jgi:hypothetical protein
MYQVNLVVAAEIEFRRVFEPQLVAFYAGSFLAQ